MGFNPPPLLVIRSLKKTCFLCVFPRSKVVKLHGANKSKHWCLPKLEIVSEITGST